MLANVSILWSQISSETIITRNHSLDGCHFAGSHKSVKQSPQSNRKVYGVPSVLMKRNKKTMDRATRWWSCRMNYWTSYKCATYKIWAKFNYPRYKSSPLFYNRQAQLIINGHDLLSKHFVPGILNHLKKIYFATAKLQCSSVLPPEITIIVIERSCHFV